MKGSLRRSITSLGLAAFCMASTQVVHAEIWQRGRLLLNKTVTTVPKAAIDSALAAQSAEMAALVGPAECDVRVDAIVFMARGPRNEAITSSGVVLTPVRDAKCKVNEQAPVVAYDHGTEFRRGFTMADPTGEETSAAMAWYAAKGYVVVAPDYHGLGASTLPYHAYLHAESEADATVDALRASRAVLAKYKLQIGKLFVTGYSQGGHAAMATVRALESRYKGEFPLVASTPMAGPYALEDTFVFGANNATLAGSAVGSYGIVGINHATRQIYAKPSDIFRPRYAATIEAYMPGPFSVDALYDKGIIPESLDELYLPTFLTALRSDANSGVRRALRANSLLEGWTPQTPMLLCAGARDPLVPYFNTPRAQQVFAARGAKVQLIEADQAFGLPPFASDDDYLNYHARTVFPLCAIATRTQLFDPLK